MSADAILSSYYTVGEKLSSAVNHPAAVHVHGRLRWFLLDMPVVPGLLFFHAFFAADRVQLYTGQRFFWFRSYFVTLFGAFGGSTVASILSGSSAPLFTNASNPMFGFITVAWYLVHNWRIVRSILRIRPVSAIMAFGATAAKARAIFSFIDRYVERFPGQVAGAIALGGLSGAGGTLLMSIEKSSFGVQHSSEIGAPGWAFKSAFFTAAMYYLGTDPEGLVADVLGLKTLGFHKDDVRFALSLFLCTHAAVEVLLGIQFNPLFLPERLFYIFTGIKANPGQSAQRDHTPPDSPQASNGSRANGSQQHKPGRNGHKAPTMRRRRPVVPTNGI